MNEYKSEVRDGMRIDWDAPIEMDDGVVLRCDVYRPDDDGEYPVIMSYGPYAKWLHLQDGYPHQWSLMVNDYPETIMGTSNKYQNWELVDPEKWVPDGYACVRVDSRGAGRSPGYLEVWSPREAQGFSRLHRVGGRAVLEQRKGGTERHLLLRDEPVAGGIALQPPHLAAMCVWEGAADFYRDSGPPRGHRLPLPGHLVPGGRRAPAARQGPSRRQEPHERGLDIRPRELKRRRTGLEQE